MCKTFSGFHLTYICVAKDFSTNYVTVTYSDKLWAWSSWKGIIKFFSSNQCEMINYCIQVISFTIALINSKVMNLELFFVSSFHVKTNIMPSASFVYIRFILVFSGASPKELFCVNSFIYCSLWSYAEGCIVAHKKAPRWMGWSESDRFSCRSNFIIFNLSF